MPASAMFDIVNVSKLKLKVTANETQVASLKAGNPVHYSQYSGEIFNGIISSRKADESLNLRNEIEIANNADNN
jgi:hypothetical protein